MDLIIRLEKAIANIALGLKVKLNNKVKDEYPESAQLKKGINMFAALMVSDAGFSAILLKERLEGLNETEFILNYLSKPIKEWFKDWNENILMKLKDSAFWTLGAFVIADRTRKKYELTYECMDYINSIENDVSTIDEHKVFELLKQCSQEDYSYLRRFLIEHPLMSDFDRRELILKYNSNEFIIDLISSAFENSVTNTHRCPKCGWTLKFYGQEIKCSSVACEKFFKRKGLNEAEKIDSAKFPYRLNLGVMRYIARPGKIELDIKKYCDDNNILSDLWPEMDKYDIKITFSNGEVWGIDAKTYGNPYLLSRSIKNDISFQSANIDKGFYVIPDELIEVTPDYLKICKSALKGRNKFNCQGNKMLI